MPEITKQGKAIQKMIRNREGNEAYDSDDEKNPYASVSIFTSFRL
jgi:transcription initiation factor TFIIF subunit alpha